MPKSLPKLDNLANLFATNIRINNIDPFDKDAVWPHNMQVCITRIPIRKRDGYSVDLIQKLANKLKSHMAKNGVVFFICYAPVEAKFRPFEVAKTMVDAGFNHVDNIVIEKTWFPGKRSETNLVNSHEYVLHFCNGEVWRLDRLPLKQFLKTPENISCPGNTWKIETGSLEDSYPYELAELLLRMTDMLPGSIVFDPFMSTTSSLQASTELGHSFYGFESDTKKINQYKKVVDEISKQLGIQASIK